MEVREATSKSRVVAPKAAACVSRHAAPPVGISLSDLALHPARLACLHRQTFECLLLHRPAHAPGENCTHHHTLVQCAGSLRRQVEFAVHWQRIRPRPSDVGARSRPAVDAQHLMESPGGWNCTCKASRGWGAEEPRCSSPRFPLLLLPCRSPLPAPLTQSRLFLPPP